jgi:hypothetical protein
VIEALQGALRRHEFQVICDNLLSASERRQAGGAACPRILAQSAGDLRRPRIVIERIQLGKDRAVVTVRTTAEGQAPAGDVVRLVRERGHFRIASLGR